MADIQELRNNLLEVNASAATLCDALTGDQLSWRPRPEAWSIAENLAHLRTTTEVFLPPVDSAILRSREQDLRATGPFRLGPYGRFLVWYVEPPPVLKLPAPKRLRPLLADLPGSELDRFLASQTAMSQRMEDAAALDLTALRFPSPLASFVRMNLLEFFSVFNGHSRRHLWQIANIRKAILL